MTCEVSIINKLLTTGNVSYDSNANWSFVIIAYNHFLYAVFFLESFNVFDISSADFWFLYTVKQVIVFSYFPFYLIIILFLAKRSCYLYAMTTVTPLTCKKNILWSNWKSRKCFKASVCVAIQENYWKLKQPRLFAVIPPCSRNWSN